jgi:hypothetical protein
MEGKTKGRIGFICLHLERDWIQFLYTKCMGLLKHLSCPACYSSVDTRLFLRDLNLNPNTKLSMRCAAVEE